MLKLQLIVTESTWRITQGFYGCWVKLSLVCSGAVSGFLGNSGKLSSGLGSEGSAMALCLADSPVSNEG